MLNLFQRQLLWVGGKGGVGKTTTAASLGVLAAQRGLRCLVVSTDPAHSLGDAFDLALADQPRSVRSHLDAVEIDPDQEVDAHLNRVLEQMKHFAAPEMLQELERQMQLTRQSPGTQEAALLERIAQLITQPDSGYDLIIFDTAPTGHTLRLMSLPEAMAAWTDGLLAHNKKASDLGRVLQHLTPKSGQDVATPFDDPEQDRFSELDRKSKEVAELLVKRRRLFYQAREIIADESKNGFLFVMTPEKLPLLETQRAVETLKQVGIPVAAVLVNRVLPATADGDFLKARRQQEALYLEQIDTSFSHLPRPRLPLMATDVQGLEALEKLAKELAAVGF